MKKLSSVTKKILAAVMAVAMLLATPSIDALAITSAGSIARGIDVSKYQGTVNWSQVAASGIKFAFIKIGSSKSGLDPTFAYNMAQAQANGIKTGVYIYSYAVNTEQAAMEAALVINWLAAYNVQMPVVFDIEDSVHKGLSSEEVNAIINTFCILVDAAGYYPMVYSYQSFFNSKIGATPWDKWVAQFGSALNYSSCSFWQNSSKATVPGINGFVDTNYQYKDYSKLIIPEGFIAHNGGTRFYLNWKMQTGWVIYQNNKYMFDPYGYMVKGWFADADGKMYYLNTSDGKASIGPTAIDSFTFYFDPNGVLTYGFVDYGAGMKYFDPTLNGAMATSWFAYNGQMFHAGKDGTVQVGYQEIDKVPFFFDENGALVTNKQVEANGKQYMAGADGILAEIPKVSKSGKKVTQADIEAYAAANGVDLATLNPEIHDAYIQAVTEFLSTQ